MQDDTGSIRVLFKDGSPEGLSEIRGEFWDLGRMNHDDPRLSGYDLRTAFQIDPDAPWPRPGRHPMPIWQTRRRAGSPVFSPRG